jgi:hypothetical protein
MKHRIYIGNYTVLLNDTELKILLEIASTNETQLIKQIDVADKLGIPLTTLNYHFKKLRSREFIDKSNRLTDECKRLLQHWKHWDKSLEKKLRAHKIQLVISLSKPPKNLDNVVNYTFTPFTNKRYNGLKTQVLGSKVMFYGGKKVVVKIPDIYGNNGDEIATSLNDFSWQIIEVLENEFDGLKVDSFKPVKYNSMHVAILDSIIAKNYILEHGSIYSNGRITVDKSHGRYELETESSKTALEDIELFVKYEDLVRENERLKTALNKYESPKK